eukprot:g19887.t1
MVDPESRGDLLLSPEEALDLGVLFTKMHIEGNDLVLDFTNTQLKVNKYKGARARCVCKELKKKNISTKFCVCYCRGEENLKQAWSQLQGLHGKNFPSYDQFKYAAKKIIGKELWIVARDYADHPETAIVKLHPDAVTIVGETMIDVQACSIDTVGTSYEGRMRRWVEVELDQRWREAFRRQERIVREREEARKEREKEDKERREKQEKEDRERALWNRDRGGKPRKGEGKRQQPYGKGKKGDRPCHFFLAGKCAFGDNCRWTHPKSEAELSKKDYELICTQVQNLKVEDYGKWLKKTTATEEEKKD